MNVSVWNFLCRNYTTPHAVRYISLTRETCWCVEMPLIGPICSPTLPSQAQDPERGWWNVSNGAKETLPPTCSMKITRPAAKSFFDRAQNGMSQGLARAISPPLLEDHRSTPTTNQWRGRHPSAAEQIDPLSCSEKGRSAGSLATHSLQTPMRTHGRRFAGRF